MYGVFRCNANTSQSVDCNYICLDPACVEGYDEPNNFQTLANEVARRSSEGDVPKSCAERRFKAHY